MSLSDRWMRAATKRGPPVGDAPLHLELVLCEDIFVVIDDGRALPSAYDAARAKLLSHAGRYAQGAGCLIIIPANAAPLPEPARKALEATLATLPVRCICWIVEGTGFQGAMVRAVLTGLRLLSRRPYPTQIVTSIEDAVSWMLPHLKLRDRHPDRAQDLATLDPQSTRTGPRATGGLTSRAEAAAPYSWVVPLFMGGALIHGWCPYSWVVPLFMGPCAT